MVYSKYKIKSSDEKLGFWISEEELISLIRICKRRNKKLYCRLKDCWEHLEQQKIKE